MAKKFLTANISRSTVYIYMYNYYKYVFLIYNNRIYMTGIIIPIIINVVLNNINSIYRNINAFVI